MGNIYYVNLTGFFQEEKVSVRDYLKLFLICDLVLDGKEVKLMEKSEKGYVCVNSKLIADFYFKRFIESKAIYRKNVPVEYSNEEDNQILISFTDDNDIFESGDRNTVFDEYCLFLLAAEDEEKIICQQNVKIYSVADDVISEKYIEKYDLKHLYNKKIESEKIDIGIKRVTDTMKYDLYVIDGNGNDGEIEALMKAYEQNDTSMKFCVVLMEGDNLENLYKKICEFDISSMMFFRKVDFLSLKQLVQRSNKCYFTQKYRWVEKYMCGREAV